MVYDKKGLITGIVMAGSGVSGAVISILLPRFIEANGYQSGYLLLAACVFIFQVPVALLLIKNSPKECGLTMYGFDPSVAGKSAQKSEAPGLTMKEARSGSQLYTLFIGITLISIVVSVSQQIPAHLKSVGLDAGTIGLLASVMMISNIVSKIIIGGVNDKIGSAITMTISLGLFCAALLILPQAAVVGLAFAAMAIVSFGSSFPTVMPPLITGEIFGHKDYASIWGVVGMASGFGMTLGTPIWGAIYDRTGSYTMGLYGGPVLVVVGAALIIFSLSSGKKRLESA